jgi:hypothetical protein
MLPAAVKNIAPRITSLLTPNRHKNFRVFTFASPSDVILWELTPWMIKEFI